MFDEANRVALYGSLCQPARAMAGGTKGHANEPMSDARWSGYSRELLWFRVRVTWGVGGQCLFCTAEFLFDPIGLRSDPRCVVDLARMGDEVTGGPNRFD
jgi:hypothetical protein